MAGICVSCGEEAEGRFCSECGHKTAHTSEIVLILRDIFKPLLSLLKIYLALIFTRPFVLDVLKGRIGLRTLFWFCFSCAGMCYFLLSLFGGFAEVQKLMHDASTLEGRWYNMCFEFGMKSAFSLARTLSMVIGYLVLSWPMFLILKSKSAPANFKAFFVSGAILNGTFVPIDALAQLMYGAGTTDYFKFVALPLVIILVALIRSLKTLFQRGWVMTIAVFVVWLVVVGIGVAVVFPQAAGISPNAVASKDAMTDDKAVEAPVSDIISTVEAGAASEAAPAP